MARETNLRDSFPNNDSDSPLTCLLGATSGIVTTTVSPRTYDGPNRGVNNPYILLYIVYTLLAVGENPICEIRRLLALRQSKPRFSLAFGRWRWCDVVQQSEILRA